jgi:hypothetical protein
MGIFVLLAVGNLISERFEQSSKLLTLELYHFFGKFWNGIMVEFELDFVSHSPLLDISLLYPHA